MAENFSSIIGTEIEIIRQRFFIDYTTKSDKHFSEEFTLYCTTNVEEGIDNIFLKIPNILPNLRIFDSDGEELSLITNKLLDALLTKRIREQHDDQIKKDLKQLQNDINERKYFVLWIKLPRSKRLYYGDSKVITLEYDAPREDLNEKIHVQELRSGPYEVFYIIKPPEDYEITQTNFAIYDSEGNKLKRHEKKWLNKKGDPIYFDEKHRSISIRVRPLIKDQVVFSYSFNPIRSILSLPNIVLGFLIGASTFLFVPKFLGIDENSPIDCGTSLVCLNLQGFITKNIEIAIGIIGASLIIAGLIHNQDIRDSLKWRFFIPIILATLAIVLKF